MIAWQPTSSFANLVTRAALVKKVRDFFTDKNILEVDTPLLSQASVTDPHIQSFITHYFVDAQHSHPYYLQTSPEYAMKRLLAAGSGPIYQICKAFRNNGEAGRFHNPEFTILEWYRPGFNHHDLMNEMDEFLQTVIASKSAIKISYADLFLQKLDINPHTATLQELHNLSAQHGIGKIPGVNENDRDCILQLLLSHLIEPNLGTDNRPHFIFDFPASQAALARIRNDAIPVAERFEVYIEGIELANGFHELADAHEQRQRFLKNLAERRELNYSAVPIDEYFLAALENNFPDCSGVAVGLDRLFMLATKVSQISDIISFPITHA